MSNVRGIVWYWIISEPHNDEAQALIQSVQDASCSAPATSVPPGAFPSVVVDVLVPPDLLPPLLPQAANTMARIADMATRERRLRITRDLPVSRESGWAFQIEETPGQLTRSPSNTVVNPKMIAVITVIRSRFFSTVVAPAIEPPSEPPPNMSESPPPRPAWSSTRKISVNETMMWKIRINGVSNVSPPTKRPESTPGAQRRSPA